MFTNLIIDEIRANACCRSQGCINPVIKPIIRQGKTKQWVNYMTRCKQCQHNMHEYGITTPERNQLLLEQDNKCGICNIDIAFEENTAHVDHCHTEGGIRGILCPQCNMALGGFRDNPSVLQSAINYLRKYNGRTTI
jgi:hypothetical protein